MSKQIQLFLLPYAGGSSFSFFKLLRFLDQRIEAVTVEYAGRGSRKEENLISNYNDFLNDVSLYIKNHRNTGLPFALLGYSLGSPITFDLIRLNLLNTPVAHIFFCAEGSLIKLGSDNSHLKISDEEFAEKMISLGGMDYRLLKNKEMLSEVLDLMKSDYNIFSQFRYYGDKLTNDCSVIYSSEDKTCFNMDDWKKITTGKISYYTMGNNHFFVNQKFREMADVINNTLLQ